MSAPLTHGRAPLSEYSDHPGARLALTCRACGWSRDYDPARIIARLASKRAGGAQTPIAEVADFVQWTCPRCRHLRWRTELKPSSSPTGGNVGGADGGGSSRRLRGLQPPQPLRGSSP